MCKSADPPSEFGALWLHRPRPRRSCSSIHPPLHPAHHCSLYHLYSSPFSSVSELESPSLQPTETGFHITFCCVLLLMATERSCQVGLRASEMWTTELLPPVSYRWDEIPVTHNPLTCRTKQWFHYSQGCTITVMINSKNTHHPKKPCTPKWLSLGVFPLVHEQPLVYFVTLGVAYVWTLYVHGIMCSALLCYRLLSLSVMPSHSTDAVAHMSTLLLFMAEYYSTVWV